MEPFVNETIWRGKNNETIYSVKLCKKYAKPMQMLQWLYTCTGMLTIELLIEHEVIKRLYSYRMAAIIMYCKKCILWTNANRCSDIIYIYIVNIIPLTIVM